MGNDDHNNRPLPRCIRRLGLVSAVTERQTNDDTTLTFIPRRTGRLLRIDPNFLEMLRLQDIVMSKFAFRAKLACR